MEQQTTRRPSDPAVVLTFLIADVRGYTRFTRERGDTAAALLAKRFADLARDAVEARGGSVIELRGDEALAVFGSPAQAVRAAVDLQATCAEESDADAAFQLPVGIGIDTGEAVPVEDGYRGAALNTAARLCSNAGAGQVLVTRGVVEAVAALEGELRFEERGPASFKGFDNAVDVIEAVPVGGLEHPPGPVIAPVVGASTIPPELDPMTPLVDREHEMRWLRGTWRQVCRGGGRIVFVSGPAQIGKTRLASEISAHAHRGGAEVRYAGPGGAATAAALSAIRMTITSSAPSLLVLDDMDVAGPTVADALATGFDALSALPVLVVCLVRDDAASAELSAVVARADERGDGHRRLPPLDIDGVRGIARLYAGDDISHVPIESMARASGGVPGRVHEVISTWARTEASRRLAAAAEFLAVGRERHASDLAFANNVIGLKLAHLYTVEERDVLALETCPYKGLAPFQEEDSAYFFGRERLVGELAARTVRAGLLGVVGASGTGKSSVIAAGLMPSLAAGLLPGSERWTLASIRPGAHPMDELHRLLEDDGPDPVADVALGLPPEGRLVFAVDQFEETFTICASEGERRAFIDALVGAARSFPERVVVILAIRGDYYAHCAPYPDLASSLEANHVLVPPLTRDELRRAIELPARRAGVRMESDLVDVLVEEVADEPGGLPLLSTALVELWEASVDGWIRSEAYEHTGGVRGAVARLAESSYGALSEVEQEKAHRVFLRLVATGDGDLVTRRRVPLDEFDIDREATTASVLARLTQDRLLTMGDRTVEVAHEALLREWPRLRGWLEEDVRGRELRQHLTGSSTQWEARGHEPSELYRGARLSAALDWSADRSADLNELEREFLSASRQASEQEAERQRRANRRLKGLLAGTALFLVIALVAGSLAVVQRGSARTSAKRAERSAIVAEAQRLDAQSLVVKSPDLSILLARQAAALDDGPETQAALFSTLLRWTGIERVIRPNGNRLLGIVVSPNGDWFAVSDNNGSFWIYDAHTFAVLHSFHHFADGMLASPDGRRLYVAWSPSVTMNKAAPPEVVEAYDVSRGSSIWRTTTGRGSESGFTISEDGRLLALADNPVLDTTSGPKPSGKPASLTLLRTSDGTRVVKPLDLGTFRGATFIGADKIATSNGDTVRILDAGSGSVIRNIRQPGLSGFAVSTDGSTLAMGDSGGDIRLLNLRSGTERTLSAPSGLGLITPVFSPNGRFLAAGGANGALVLWNARTGVARQLAGHTGNVVGVSFSAEGHTLYTDGLDGTAIVWDLMGAESIQRSFSSRYVKAQYFPYAAFTPDGTTIAITGGDHRTRFFSAQTLRPTGALPQGSLECCMPPAFPGTGDLMATVSGTGADLWNSATGTLVRHLYKSSKAPSTLPVDADAMSPDGKTVAANDGNTVVLLNTSTGAIERRIDAGWYVAVLAFSPGGDLVAAGGGPPSGTQYSAVWDAVTGKRLWQRPVEAQSSLGSFSPDGRLYAVGTNDGKVYVFDARTGQPVGKPFVGEAGYTFSVGFDPALPLVAATGTDGVVTLSDPRTGRPFGDPLSSGNAAWGTGAWSPDGSEYVLVENDGTGHVWRTSLQGWESRACETAGRTLTRQEWEQFLPDQPFDPVCR